MTFFLVFVLTLAVLGILVARFGADSRDGRDWQPYDIGALRRTERHS